MKQIAFASQFRFSRHEHDRDISSYLDCSAVPTVYIATDVCIVFTDYEAQQSAEHSSLKLGRWGLDLQELVTDSVLAQGSITTAPMPSYIARSMDT